MKEKAIIAGLKKNNPKSQKELYHQYSGRFMALCLRYLKDEARAEDVLIQGFMKVFQEIKKYNDYGSFQAWMYRIFINLCLMEIRKNKQFMVSLHSNESLSSIEANALDKLYEEDLLDLIHQLPEGCRTVFNMFIIEGFSHKEIAYKLDISEGTSKSQLNLAKTKLKALIQEQYKSTGNGR